MAAKLGYGGLANTNGARDFTGKDTVENGYRFRSNEFNRRRFGGLWYPVLLLFGFLR